MDKTFIIVLSFLHSFLLQSQITLQCKVIDGVTKEPLAFAHVINTTTDEGFLSNENGFVDIKGNSSFNRIEILYLGYLSKSTLISELKLSPEIQLLKDENLMEEVTVSSNDDYLYDLVEKAKKNLKKKSGTSKAFLLLETERNGVGTEMVQAFYNAEITGNSINLGALKNGRIALADSSGQFFISLGTSKVISNICLSKDDGTFPLNPLSKNKKYNKNHYFMSRRMTNPIQNTIHIGFTPKNESADHWEGELWINKENHELVKVNLSIKNANRKPFFTFNKLDEIDHLDMNLQLEFSEGLPRMVVFEYSFIYLSNFHANMEIKAKGVLDLYDKNNLFFIPLINYDLDCDDYRKISMIPYNELFWATVNLPPFTSEQKTRMDQFLKEGTLLNFNAMGNKYSNRSGLNPFEHSFFEHQNLIWTKDKRWTLLPTRTIQEAEEALTFKRDNLVVQILLDAVETDSGYVTSSATLLDVFKSTYHLSNEPKYNCYLNIYFDICELERVKMQDHLDRTSNLNKEKIKAIYQETISSLQAVTKRYKNEVNKGENLVKLKDWNDIIISNLKIDNFQFFGFKN